MKKKRFVERKYPLKPLITKDIIHYFINYKKIVHNLK